MASNGINKAIILGNLGEDPKTQYMPNGNAVTNISVATSISWQDQQGQKQEKTEWHRISAFGKLAEIIDKFLKKGSKVYIEGRLETKKYQAKDGTDRYSTSIIANEMQMLDSRSEGQQSHPQDQQARQAPQQQTASAQSAPDFDDDIPF